MERLLFSHLPGNDKVETSRMWERGVLVGASVRSQLELEVCCEKM